MKKERRRFSAAFKTKVIERKLLTVRFMMSNALPFPSIGILIFLPIDEWIR
jgi:hypothetical protein